MNKEAQLATMLTIGFAVALFGWALVYLASAPTHPHDVRRHRSEHPPDARDEFCGSQAVIDDPLQRFLRFVKIGVLACQPSQPGIAVCADRSASVMPVPLICLTLISCFLGSLLSAMTRPLWPLLASLVSEYGCSFHHQRYRLFNAKLEGRTSLHA